MSPKKLLNITAIIGVLIAIFSFVAILAGWYIKFWYADIVMHFWGGIFVGSFFLWFWFYSGYFREFPFWQNKKFLCIFLSALSVVIGWEVFEYFLGFNKYPEGYKLDTSTDIVMGLLGSTVAFRFLKDKIKNINIDE